MWKPYCTLGSGTPSAPSAGAPSSCGTSLRPSFSAHGVPTVAGRCSECCVGGEKTRLNWYDSVLMLSCSVKVGESEMLRATPSCDCDIDRGVVLDPPRDGVRDTLWSEAWREFTRDEPGVPSPKKPTLSRAFADSARLAWRYSASGSSWRSGGALSSPTEPSRSSPSLGFGGVRGWSGVRGTRTSPATRLGDGRDGGGLSSKAGGPSDACCWIHATTSSKGALGSMRISAAPLPSRDRSSDVSTRRGCSSASCSRYSSLRYLLACGASPWLRKPMRPASSSLRCAENTSDPSACHWRPAFDLGAPLPALYARALSSFCAARTVTRSTGPRTRPARLRATTS
mmetsp:Transcript_4737/g.13491  ORF Transcript_4737/g.13491 Transcript_4737/m.13491 type:complete len:341 (-) Transcript_4737:1620-2642(-)